MLVSTIWCQDLQAEQLNMRFELIEFMNLVMLS
jgi:hypothetical protein